MSDNCETFEVLLSTLLDQGLDHPRQRQLLDHLSRCAGCRRFYREARALEGLVAVAVPAADLEEAPADVWRRIERRARPGRPALGRRPLTWALAAAAALLVGVTLPFVPWPSGRVAADTKTIDVLLEGDRDGMTEARFVELTTELLQADRKYHFAMQDVMEAVIESSWEAEGATSEGKLDEDADDENKEGRSRVRT